MIKFTIKYKFLTIRSLHKHISSNKKIRILPVRSFTAIVRKHHVIRHQALTICQNPSSDSMSSAYIGVHTCEWLYDLLAPIEIVLRDFKAVRRIQHVCCLY